MAPTAAAAAPAFRNLRRLGFFASMDLSFAAFFLSYSSLKCRAASSLRGMYASQPDQIKLSFAKAMGQFLNAITPIYCSGRAFSGDLPISALVCPVELARIFGMWD